ncbi:MAG: hypothetical protein QNL33_11195 [Akkermansiaceae bacterium]
MKPRPKPVDPSQLYDLAPNHDHDHDQLRISGEAEVITDGSILEEIWAANPHFKNVSGLARQSRIYPLPHRAPASPLHARSITTKCP